jgi:3-dehydroquinate dehydratase-2
MKILVMNGPNLNLLGEREPEVYGGETMLSINDEILEKGRKMGYDVVFFQSNSEGGLIDRLHEARLDCAGVILNAGAYTHYSYALRDAISAVKIPVIEVHMSNVNSRDEFRHKSVIAPVCRGTIAGFGKHSYVLALYALDNIFGKADEQA